MLFLLSLRPNYEIFSNLEKIQFVVIELKKKKKKQERKKLGNSNINTKNAETQT